VWNNLCILLVANNIKCRIVDGCKFQHCEGNCVSMIWQGRTFRQGFRYSGYSLAYSGCIFLRKFRNSRTVDFRYDERVSRAKREYICKWSPWLVMMTFSSGPEKGVLAEECDDVVVLINSISVRCTVNDLTESTLSVLLPKLWDS
jgi:hypothetical protein